MAGVDPSNYVHSEMVDGYCLDSCSYQYNYQPITNDPKNKKISSKSTIEISISNPDKYKCKFSGDKYKLTRICIILDPTLIRNSYERYATGDIKGELIMVHEKDSDSSSKLNICISIKSKSNTGGTHLQDIIETGTPINLNEFMVSEAYNYYNSDNNSGGDVNSNWIVFDSNQSSLTIDNTMGLPSGTDNISLPKAPATITSIQYHELGPQYNETSRMISCARIKTDSNYGNDPEGKKILNEGTFGIKDSKLITVIVFGMFIGIVGILLSIGFFANKYKRNTSSNSSSNITTFNDKFSTIKSLINVEDKKFKIGIAIIAIIAFVLTILKWTL